MKGVARRGAPDQAVGRVGSGEGWLDLSHPIDPSAAPIGSFDVSAKLSHIKRMPRDPLNVSVVELCCHDGTHLDAPCHFIEGGEAIGEVEVQRLCGEGVVLRVSAEPFELIEPHHLEAGGPRVRKGDIVFLDSGWSGHVGKSSYFSHPSLSAAAAEWLVEREVRLLGVDFVSPDLSASRRSEGFDWPIHQTLLRGGTLVAENLTNLEPLSGRRIEALCLPLPIVGADGSPARILARPTLRILDRVPYV